MEKEVIEGIINSIGKSEFDSEDMPYFSDKRYKSFRIDKKNFHQIKEINSGRKVAFIDGGNSEIVKAANFSLHFVRVYYSVWQDNKKIKGKKREFYVLVNTFNDGKKGIKYKTEIYGVIGLEKEDLVFDSYDETLREGMHRVNISRIGEIARRFAELKAAEEAVDELEEGDILVRDGSLQSSVTNESKYFESLYKKAVEKGVLVMSISKSSNLITEKGNSLAALLNTISGEGAWYYHPIADIEHPEHQAELFMAKLHPNSKYVFRLESYKKQKFDFEEVFGLLMCNSKDPVFLGYPYGLIDADRFARVSNNEKEGLKMQLRAKIGRDFDMSEIAKRRKLCTSVQSEPAISEHAQEHAPPFRAAVLDIFREDAHSVLDKIAF